MIGRILSFNSCMPRQRHVPRDRLTTLCRWRKLSDSSVASWRPAGPCRSFPISVSYAALLRNAPSGGLIAHPRRHRMNRVRGWHWFACSWLGPVRLQPASLPPGNDEAERMLPKVRYDMTGRRLIVIPARGGSKGIPEEEPQVVGRTTSHHPCDSGCTQCNLDRFDRDD